MNCTNDAANEENKSTMRPQLVVLPKKRIRHANNATCLNLGVKRSIQRVVLDSEIDLTDMRAVVQMFRMPQRTIIQVLREGHRELKHQLLELQSGRMPDPPAGQMRRAA